MIYSTVGHFVKIYPYPQKYVTNPLLSQIDSFSTPPLSLSPKMPIEVLIHKEPLSKK